MDVSFVLICAALVFLMQAGFCMLESGMIRAKNSINVAVKNLLDFAISMIVFAVIGFSLMFGPSFGGIFGGVVAFWAEDSLTAFFLFQMVFCGTAATIVSGAIAERSKMTTYLVVVLVLSGLVYPLIGHWCWGGALIGTGSGWLASLGLVDWAGATVVHLTGGFAALAAVMAIGPRRHYSRSKLTGGHSLTLAILGCFLIWFGWWGFNGGSSLNSEGNVSLVLLNTNLGAVAGALAAAGYSVYRTFKTDVVDIVCGTLAGLVSVTAACHAISPLAAIVIGAIGALLALGSIELLKTTRHDDVVGAFGVHGIAGMWGTIAFAVFAPSEMLPTGGRLSQFLVQSLACFIAASFSWGTIYGTLRIMSRFTRLRVRAAEERQGLNVVEHGATNEVTDLLTTMADHRETGDFSVPVAMDTDSEAGQIANEYNAVIARVNDEVKQHKETNEFLNSERIRTQSLLENAGVGIYQLDAQGRFQSANVTLLEITGIASAGDLIDQDACFQIPWHSSEIRQQLQANFDLGRSVRDVEIEFHDQDGQPRWLLESIVPLRDENGRLINWLGTVHDVTDRKQAMMVEVEVAEAKSAAKGEFLANMSHEIRTPLNGVIGMLDLLSTSELDRKSENYLSVARSSAESLLSLINDILDFSKIEAGKITLESATFDIRELMESTAEQFAIRAHLAGLELNCELAADLPYTVNGDPERLRQCIINLLGNAIKFTESGEINLRVSRRGTVIHFSVEDTGIGIADDTQDKLFESFVQADAGTTRRYGGTGLGLTIVKQLVELMGGKLKLDSALGEGSNFWFELPLPVVEEQLPKRSEAIDNSSLANRNVLIVDDNATNCHILENQLASWGLKSSICSHSTTVVQKLLVANQLGKPFDLIILDFCMPEMNGRDVALELQKHAVLRSIPIIMLSSNHDLMRREELEEAGIAIAMTKPARQSRLFDSIVSLLYSSPKRGDGVDSLDQPTVPSRPGSTAVESSRATELKTGITSTLSAVDIASAQPNQEKTEVDVLIAEDNQVNQIVVQQMLNSLGYSSEVVCNGKAAWDRITESSFGLVLMDGHMPVMDGLTACENIRRWEQENGRKQTPIVALTANVVVGYKGKCIEAGMNGYLAKPISLKQLRMIAAEYLGVGSPETRTPIGMDLPTPRAAEKDAVVRPKPQPVLQMPTTMADGTVHEVGKESSAVVVAQEPSTHAVLCDVDSLLERCSGDDMVKRQLLEIMHNALPTRLTELREADTNRDMERVRLVSHQLKGAAGDTSLLAVQKTASDLEELARGNRSELVPSTISKLADEIDLTIEEISNLLARS